MMEEPELELESRTGKQQCGGQKKSKDARDVDNWEEGQRVFWSECYFGN